MTITDYMQFLFVLIESCSIANSVNSNPATYGYICMGLYIIEAIA